MPICILGRCASIGIICGAVVTAVMVSLLAVFGVKKLRDHRLKHSKSVANHANTGNANVRFPSKNGNLMKQWK
jgi:hypothetical protein